MRTIFTGLLVYILSICTLSAQNKIDITDDELCDIPPNLQKIQSVESFKDSLTLSINLREIYIGKKIKEIEFKHTEVITTESSIIKVNKDMAIRISIARVVDNGEKCYLYKIHLFERYKDCWYDKNATGGWSIGKIGTFNSGYYHGKKGEDCFGYDGDITIN
jgi:hypothetical protein